jgi:hypothetical protein
MGRVSRRRRTKRLIAVLTLPILIVGLTAITAAASGGAFRGSSNHLALTPKDLENAKLPAGVCSSGTSGVPLSGAIQLSNGEGTVGTIDTQDFFGAEIIGTPVPINLGGPHHVGVAAAIACGQGGSAEWDEMWVFSGSATKLVILFGGVLPRTYSESEDAADGSLIRGISAKAHSLVVQEGFAEPGQCGACATGRAATTWSWSPANPGHLVITQPAPKNVKVTHSTTPHGWGKLPPTRNQAGPALSAGHTVLAICTAPIEGVQWTELETGGWVLSADLEPAGLPDCDAATPTPSAAPCTAQAITAAAKAGLSKLTPFYALNGFGCSGDFAFGAVAVGTQPHVTTITVLFMAVNGAWHVATRTRYCKNGSVPAAIYEGACETN